MAVIRDPRPNFLLIVSDEHNSLITEGYGHPVVQTPHLDRLAEEGVLFENAYCNSPTCVCSRASMMTGRYIHQIGVLTHHTPLRPDIPTFANYFEAAGYDIILCGKMHFVGKWNQTHGFGKRLLGEPEQWVGRQHWDKKPRTRTDQTRPQSNSHVTDAGSGTPYFPVRYDAAVTDLTVRFLEAQAKYPSPHPWLFICGLLAPHFPLYRPEDLFDLCYPDRIVWPKVGYQPGQAEHPVIHQIRRWLCQEDGLSDETTHTALAAYYGLITMTDRNVGRMLAAPDRSERLRRNTVVIYLSDHGETAGEHGLWQKFCFYEPSVRVPLIRRLPEGPMGRRVAEPVSLVDLAPTLCDLADITKPDQCVGTSLLPLVGGAAGKAAGRPVFAEYHAHGITGSAYMIRKGPFKYNYYPGYPPQLFRLDEDPDEVHDLSADPDYTQIVGGLHDALRAIADPGALAARVKEFELLSGLEAVQRWEV